MKGLKFRLAKNEQPEADHEFFYSVPDVFYFWPSILFGYAYPVLDNWILGTLMAWTYLVISWFCLLTVCEDLDWDRLKSLVKDVIMVAMAASLIRLMEWHHYFGGMGRFIYNLDMYIGGGVPFVTSLALTIWLFIRLISTFRRPWRIDHNQFEHIIIGKSDYKFNRAMYDFSRDYPNLLRRFLGFGAGCIKIVDKGRHTVAVANDLFRLAKKADRMDAILSTASVTEVDSAERIVVAREDGESEDESSSSVEGKSNGQSQEEVVGHE